ncbi:MAG: APC family permease [Clostridia bacterium]|nr:APC family permease [Clostridia bacterium]
MKRKQNKLSPIDILSIALGSIIGWGSFTLPGTKFLPESGVINTAIGLTLGGLAVIFIQIGYRIMMENHFEDGGEFSYTYENMGKLNGFIVGWSLILCYLSLVPLNATAFVLVIKRIFGPSNIEKIYLYNVAGYPVYLSEILIASAVILLFAYINIRGVKTSARAQNLMVLFLVINVVIVLIVMGFKADKTIFVENYIQGQKVDFGKIARVLAIAPFLFVGFDVIPQVSTELNFKPTKAITMGIISLFAGIFIYNSLNLITALAYGPEEALKQEWALGTAVLNNIGMVGFVLLVVALISAVVSGINGFMLGSSKLIGALAIYKLFPEKYKKKNKAGVNENAIKFVTLVGLIAPFFGRQVILYIVDMSSLLAALAYAYVCYISSKLGKNRLERHLSKLGVFVSIIFIALLVIPVSPARLSGPAIMFMVAWVIAGVFYYRKCNAAYKTAQDI